MLDRQEVFNTVVDNTFAQDIEEAAGDGQIHTYYSYMNTMVQLQYHVSPVIL